MNATNVTQDKLKGVILAGGLGTRLLPLTQNTNKHLIPIQGKPMITYPLETLIHSGIDEILIVTDKKYAQAFQTQLEPYQSIAKITFAFQEKPLGPADALAKAQPFAQGSPICVALGDNIIQYDLEQEAKQFLANPYGAKILLKHTDHPQYYGIATLENQKIINITEKPKHPLSNHAVIGYYFYDISIFDLCQTIDPNNGVNDAFQITDINNAYIQRRQMQYAHYQGWWVDAGTAPAIAQVSDLLQMPIQNSIPENNAHD